MWRHDTLTSTQYVPQRWEGGLKGLEGDPSKGGCDSPLEMWMTRNIAEGKPSQVKFVPLLKFNIDTHLC